MATSPEKIWETVRTFMDSRVILTGVELGVFGVLADGARTSADVAGALKSDSKYTDRLLNALVVQGLLEKNDGLFRNSEAAEKCLVPGLPGYAADGLMHIAYLWHTWTHLTEVVRTGQPAPSRPSDANAKAVAFIAAMHHNATARAPRVAAALDLSGVKRLLDVGGGSGDYAMAFCRANDSITATVFDLPEICPITQGYIDRAGMANKVDTFGGDYLADEFPKGFDLALLCAVIHSNSPTETQTIFAKTYRALNPGGRILVQDWFMDDTRLDPPAGAMFSLNMLVGTPSGDTYTQSETTQWLREAGFTDIHRLDVPGGTTSLLLATKNAE